MKHADPHTLPLPFPTRTEAELALNLANSAGKRVELTLTTNRSRMASFQRKGNAVSVRLHRAFLDADDKVLHPLGHWISGRTRRVPQEVREFIRNIETPTDSSGSGKQRKLYHRGDVFDLAVLAEEVNRHFFNGEIDANVTWGRDTSSKRVRHRRLGSFTHSDRLIIIHPVLDDRRVPEYVVHVILHHEMLHSLQPADQKRVHDAAFRRAEQQHPDYERAEKWLKRHAGLIHGGRGRRTPAGH